MAFTIYKVTNRVNGKIYVGLTTQKPRLRWMGHIQSALDPRAKSCGLISKAIRKYGRENFVIEVLDTSATTFEELAELELHYIKDLNSGTPNGYNQKTERQGNNIHTLESKAKISAKLKGVPKSAAHRAKIQAFMLERNSHPEELEKKRQRRLGKTSETSWKAVIRRDLQTGEEVEFRSITDACRAMGINLCFVQKISFLCQNKPYLHKTSTGEVKSLVRTQVKGFHWRYKDSTEKGRCSVADNS